MGRAIDRLTMLDENLRCDPKPFSNDKKIDIPSLCDIINHDFENCTIVCSNLRRAISTACISVAARLEPNPNERIEILSCLQELGTNYDTIPSTEKSEKPKLSRPERKASVLDGKLLDNVYNKRLGERWNLGDQRGVDKEVRIQTFMDWVWDQPKTTCVAFGHSHWIREFFRMALRKASLPEEINVKKFKLNNC